MFYLKTKAVSPELKREKIISIIIIISNSTVLARTLSASHMRFRYLIKTLGRTPLDE
jgi:hypothetical protein